MTEPHLTEVAVEALAHGRPELVDAPGRAHVARCADCAAAVEEARLLSEGAAEALRAATPLADDLDTLIAGAMAKAAPAAEVPHPSRRALVWAALAGLVATVGLGLASLPSMASVVAVVKDSFAVLGALDRVVDVAVPGGWTLVTFAGFLLLLLLAAPLRALVRGTSRAPGAGGVTTLLFPFVLLLSVLAAAPGARALELEGQWPDEERAVTVSVDHEPASVALRAAAESVGLGLAATLPEDPEVTLHVRDASLKDVVEAVLGDAPVVARRTPTMLVIRPVEEPAAAPAPANGAAPPAPPAPPEPPAPAPGPAADRVTFGEDVVVRAGERVGDVVTMGGDVVVEGEVMGDVVSMGGDVELREGGVVHGELVTMGGEVTVDEGARLHGGNVGMNVPRFRGRIGDRDYDDEGHGGGGAVGDWLRKAVGSAARHALLFLLGVLLLALAPERLGALRVVIARSPVRACASGLLGFVGAVVLTVVLVITILGIPAAIIVALGAFAAVYVGLVAVASVVGAALPVTALRDRPILQLAAGIFVLYLASLVPVIGALAVLFASALGFGAVLLTRFRKNAPT